MGVTYRWCLWWYFFIEIDESLPYVIEGEKYQVVAVIENEKIVPYNDISSGYVRYNGKVKKVSELNIQERYVTNDYKVIAIAPFHSCTIIEKNDRFLENLQEILNFADVINNADVSNLDITIGTYENKNVFRKDEVKEFGNLDALLQNAPEKEQNMFKIPKVIN